MWVVPPCWVGCKTEPAPAPAPSSAAVPGSSPTPSASSSAEGPSADGKSDSANVIRLPADVGVGDELGYAVAAAGERVVVAAHKRKGKTEDSHPGSLFVYQVKAGKLAFETELGVEGSHQIGNALAFDGTLAVTGAHYDRGKSPETGAAYVFAVEGATWAKPVKLSASDGKKDDSFGIGVALAGGSVIVTNTREMGGALYGFEGGKQGFVAKPPLPFRHPSGPAEMLSASGELVVVGAPFTGKVSEQGAVFVFRKDKTGLHQQAELSETGAAELGHFGSSVVVHGAQLAATSNKQISVFAEKDGRWQESARITPALTVGLADAALALTDDLLAVGFHLVEAGRVLLYKKSAAGWKLERTVRAPDGKNEDWFGYTLALTPKHLVVGAPLVAERTGAVYVLGL
ncbi:MAG: hypothetical protein IPI67_38360 [Myxococcales bacterium]|nr:hypothetical protein [Myxococcales bacterium]